MIIGVTNKFANIENNMVAAANAPNCATIVKFEKIKIPKPNASAILDTIRGVASSFTAVFTASS